MTNSALILFGSDAGYGTGSGASSPCRTKIGMGSYDGTTFKQKCFALSEPDGQASGSPAAHLSSDRIYFRLNDSDGTTAYEVEWTAASSTSFTVTIRNQNATTNANIGYIAIALPSDWHANVSTETTQTGTPGDQSYTPSGVSGWTPQILLQVLTLAESVDAAKTDDEAGGIGLRIVIGTGSDDECCYYLNIEDAAGTTNTECGTYDRGFLNDHDGSGGYDMSLKSFNSGGWD